MALINCPECGGQVSDRAPVCPHCGFPLSETAASAVPTPNTAATTASAASMAGQPVTASATPTADPNLHQRLHPSEEENANEDEGTMVEPFRIRLAGRPIPVAFILFFGGMSLGTIIAFGFPVPEGVEPEPWRRTVPMAMVWAGVLWFAVTEFIALVRNRMRRR